MRTKAKGPQRMTVGYLVSTLAFLIAMLATLAFLNGVFAAQVFAATVDVHDSLVTEFECAIDKDIARKIASRTHVLGPRPAVAPCDDATVSLKHRKHLVTVFAYPSLATPEATGWDCDIDDPWRLPAGTMALGDRWVEHHRYRESAATISVGFHGFQRERDHA